MRILKIRDFLQWNSITKRQKVDDEFGVDPKSLETNETLRCFFSQNFTSWGFYTNYKWSDMVSPYKLALEKYMGLHWGEKKPSLLGVRTYNLKLHFYNCIRGPPCRVPCSTILRFGFRQDVYWDLLLVLRINRVFHPYYK